VARIEPFFLPATQGARFCVLHRPREESPPNGAVLFVPPFAEEMNKARRMVALQARAFADAGWNVLHMDLFGCGDSSGDFGDATWQGWIDDLTTAVAWLREHVGFQPMLWGLRAGCLLATELAKTLAPAVDLLLWQPGISGKQLLSQFLRVKIANQILRESGGDRTGTQQLRAQLAAGAKVEVAGYMLSPELALGLEAAELELQQAKHRIAWFELSSSASGELSPAARKRIDTWRAAGHHIESRVIAGSAFWQTQEIEECPELIKASLSIVEGWQE
jgi:exosortase A-associated hydrolase 2